MGLVKYKFNKVQKQQDTNKSAVGNLLKTLK